MNFKTSRIFAIGSLLTMSGLVASPARAQGATFHLPFRAQWGRVTLDPGDYKLWAPLGVSGGHMIQLVGPGKRSTIIVPAVTSTEPATNHSYLECVNINGTYVVRRFVTANTGEVFNFGVAKGDSERKTKASVSALVIPVKKIVK